MRVMLAAAFVSVLGIAAPAAAQVELIPKTGPLLAAPSGDDQTGFMCPMHPDVTSAEPGKCSRCGMELIAGNPLMASDFKLTVEATPQLITAGQPVRFRFTAVHPLTGQKVSSYAIVHDRPFHLFVLSRDMEHFEHVHPQQESDGSFTIQLTLPKPGHYMLYSDFFPQGGAPQVIATPVVTAGFEGDVQASLPTLQPDSSWIKTANGVQAQLRIEPRQVVAGEDLDLPIHFDDAATGAPVTDLQRYLGAFGHALILSEDMVDYIHAHPEEQLEGTTVTSGGGPDVVFHALFPKPGRYRIWLQFQRHDTLATVVFTLRALKPGETSATP